MLEAIKSKHDEQRSLQDDNDRLKDEVEESAAVLRFAQPSDKWISWPSAALIKQNAELQSAHAYQIQEVEAWSRGELANISTLQFASAAYGKSFKMGNSYYEGGTSTKVPLRGLTKIVVWQDGQGVGRIEFHDCEGEILGA